MAIEIEREPLRTSRCECCGGVTTNLTRFVYRDGNTYAVYYARFSDNHPDGIVSALIGLGEWGDGASPEERIAFAVEIRVLDGEYQVMVTDRSRSPWSDVTFMGGILDRQEGLAHPLVGDVFHLTDHIVHEDPEVHQYLERTSPSSFGAH